MKKVFGLLMVVLSIPLWGQNERWAREQAKEFADQYYRYYFGQTAFFAQYNDAEIESRMATLYQELYNFALNRTQAMGYNFYHGYYTDADFNREFDRLRHDLNSYAHTRIKQLFSMRERSGHLETRYEPRFDANVVILRMAGWQNGKLVQYWVWDD